MTRDELIEKLKGFEWNDVEFKEGARNVPKDAWSTVSAFSNTAGGYLVFGVRYTNGVHDIVGVIEVDKVQNDFLSALRGGQKVNRPNFGNRELHQGGRCYAAGLPYPGSAPPRQACLSSW